MSVIEAAVNILDDICIAGVNIARFSKRQTDVRILNNKVTAIYGCCRHLKNRLESCGALYHCITIYRVS